MIDIEDLRKKHAWLDLSARQLDHSPFDLTHVIRYRDSVGNCTGVWCTNQDPIEQRRVELSYSALSFGWTDPVEFTREEIEMWPGRKVGLQRLARSVPIDHVVAYFSQVTGGRISIVPPGQPIQIESFIRGYYMVPELVPSSMVTPEKLAETREKVLRDAGEGLVDIMVATDRYQARDLEQELDFEQRTHGCAKNTEARARLLAALELEKPPAAPTLRHPLEHWSGRRGGRRA